MPLTATELSGPHTTASLAQTQTITTLTMDLEKTTVAMAFTFAHGTVERASFRCQAPM